MTCRASIFLTIASVLVSTVAGMPHVHRPFERAACNADLCYRAVAAVKMLGLNDCTASIKTIVTPCPFITSTASVQTVFAAPQTVTMTATSFTTSTLTLISTVLGQSTSAQVTSQTSTTIQTSTMTIFSSITTIVARPNALISKRNAQRLGRAASNACVPTTSAIGSIPAYAMLGCALNFNRYSSACACLGASATTSTLPRATLTQMVTTSTTVTPTIISTSTQILTASVITTLPSTSISVVVQSVTSTIIVTSVTTSTVFSTTTLTSISNAGTTTSATSSFTSSTVSLGTSSSASVQSSVAVSDTTSSSSTAITSSSSTSSIGSVSSSAAPSQPTSVPPFVIRVSGGTYSGNAVYFDPYTNYQAGIANPSSATQFKLKSDGSLYGTNIDLSYVSSCRGDTETCPRVYLVDGAEIDPGVAFTSEAVTAQAMVCAVADITLASGVIACLADPSNPTAGAMTFYDCAGTLSPGSSSQLDGCTRVNIVAVPVGS